MPNIDGGHYFLTVLAPVRTDTMIDPVVGRSRSHLELLRQKLSLMSPGPHSAGALADAPPSPFSRNTLNHLARFVVIDDPHFNGRRRKDTLLGVLRKADVMAPQAMDSLSSPYLLFAAEFDAQGLGDRPALEAYAAALWATMAEDLRVIFGHCRGFEDVTDAAGFAAYLRRCQVETTLPFNDYWAYGLQASDNGLPLGALRATAVVAVAALVVWIAALLALTAFTLAGADTPADAAARWVAGGVVVAPALLGAVALAVLGLLRWVNIRGRRPFPTAPDSDLPSILKALMLQQAFTRFAIDAQGLDDTELHARFGRFLDATRPDAPEPTQPPGVIRTASAGSAR